MIVIKDALPGTYVFFYGPTNDFPEGLDIEYDVFLEESANVHEWPEGAARPDSCLGQSPHDPKTYRVFLNSAELYEAGYRPAASNYEYFDERKELDSYLHLRNKR